DVEEIVFETGAGGLASIVAGDTTYVNRALAEHYGLETVPARDDEWQRVTLPRELAAGLLSRGAVAAVHTGNGNTSIVRRGLFVRTRLLCDTIGSPPDGAMA